MPAGNDTGIFITAFTFLILAEFFVGAIGVETRSFDVSIGRPYSTDSNGTSTADTGTIALGVVNCVITAISPVLDLAEFLSFPGLNGCGAASLIKKIPILGDVLNFAQSIFVFFEQFFAYQFTTLPLWLNMVIFVPSSSTMVFIGLRFVRGVS